MSVEVRAADPTADPGARLLAAMVAEVAELYGPGDPGQPGFGVTPEQLSPPGGAFLLVWEAGEPVACGGVKRWSSETGEIKRMYVVPEARSRGLARRLLAALEQVARELGYVRARLDTGPEQPHALALYRACGYSQIPDYNGNRRASYWFEKEL